MTQDSLLFGVQKTTPVADVRFELNTIYIYIYRVSTNPGETQSPHLGLKPAFKPPAHSMDYSSLRNHKHEALGFTELHLE